MSNAQVSSEQDRLHLALSSAGMGTWDWDLPADSMWWDERMLALFRLPRKTFDGSFDDFSNLIHEADRQRIREEFAGAISTRSAVDTEFRIIWPSDASEHTLGSGQPSTARRRPRSNALWELLGILPIAAKPNWHSKRSALS